MRKQTQTPKHSGESKEENIFLTDDNAPFQDLFGILTASKGASLENMKQSVLQRAKERFSQQRGKNERLEK